MFEELLEQEVRTLRASLWITADKASIHSRVSWESASFAAGPNCFSGFADMLVSPFGAVGVI